MRLPTIVKALGEDEKSIQKISIRTKKIFGDMEILN